MEKLANYLLVNCVPLSVYKISGTPCSLNIAFICLITAAVEVVRSRGMNLICH